MVAHVNTVAFHGIEARNVDVQVHIAAGLPAFTVVGLPDKAVGESRERVRAALGALGLALPPKRIILIDGEAAGAINRVPAEGEARANMHVGATPLQIALSPRDREICEAIGPALRERGMIFVGIDVIGDYLTEINVTSPTGIQEIGRFDGVSLEARIWDAIEARVDARGVG